MGSKKRVSGRGIVEPDALARTHATPVPGTLTTTNAGFEDTVLGQSTPISQSLESSDPALDETHAGGASPSGASPSGASPSGASVRRRTEPMLQTVFEGYVLLDRLGEGGMGVVYAAYDQTLDRKVALKLLRATNDDESDHAATTGKILREAQAMAKLSHPNVVSVFEVGIGRDRVFIAMEFVDGATLTEWLKKEPRRWQDIVKVIVQAGRGLEAAHRADMVHRDFKPDNVMIGKNGEVRVTDFGLARQVSALQGIQLPVGLPVAAGPITPSSQTMTGQILGTPVYMAPEQHGATHVDGRADQFSFCVTLYEALFGVRPFSGATYIELAVNVATGAMRPIPATPRIPRYVRNVLSRGLSTDPEKRYPSMTELLAELDRGPSSKRNLALACVGVIGIGIGAASLLLARPHHVSPCSDSNERLASIWNDGKRDAITKAFAATGLPYADLTRTSVFAIVDRRAGDWVKMHRDTCEATRVRGEQSEALLDRRMQCLDHERAELATFVDVLAGGGKDVVQNALVSVHQLPSLDACDDTDALMSSVAIPHDPAVRNEVEELQRELTRGRLMLNTAHLEDGLKVAKNVVDRSRKVPYVPSEAEGLLLEGLIEAQRGNAKVAEDLMTQASERADVARADRVKASALIELVWVVGYLGGQPAKAELLERLAHAALQRLGDQPELEAKLANNTGAVLYTEGRYTEGIAENSRALELRRKLFGEDHPDVAASLDVLADNELRAGKAKEAREHHARALDILTRVLGAEHPSTAQALNNLGNDLATAGDYAGAEQDYRKALEIWTRAYGPKHSQVAIALSNLGALAFTHGDPAGAIVEFQKALDIERQVFGPKHPSCAETLARLGQAELAAKDYARAIETTTEAVEIWTAQPHVPSEAQLAKFTLAQALWAARKDRPRAVALAGEARTALLAEGASARESVDDITEWLSDHKL